MSFTTRPEPETIPLAGREQTSIARCPKCAYECTPDRPDCPACGVILAKAGRAAREAATVDASAGAPTSLGSPLERFAAADRLFVKQSVERLEAFTGFECANNYTILDENGIELFLAGEEPGTTGTAMLRQFLKSMRPFTMHVTTPLGEPVFDLVRPWKLFFQEIHVKDRAGRLLGSTHMRWSFFNRVYRVDPQAGGNEYEIFGPMFRPWTFRINGNGLEQGEIRKKWGGLAREFFTDADLFGIEFPRGISVELKAVFLGALFLIDFCHFEDNNDD